MLPLACEELFDQGAHKASTDVPDRRSGRVPVVLLLVDSLLLSFGLAPTYDQFVWQRGGMQTYPDHRSGKGMSGCIEAALCHLVNHMRVCEWASLAICDDSPLRGLRRHSSVSPPAAIPRTAAA